MAQNFTGLSELLLGQAQPKQFQSYDDEQPTGWWWGSTVKDDGTFEPNGATTSTEATNSYTEMPRSYASSDRGTYFNWYAVTAESGAYAVINYDAPDSVCPSGWGLPVSSGDGTIDTWGDLFSYYTNTEGNAIGKDAASHAAIRQMPLSFQDTGLYTLGDGSFSNTNVHETRLWQASSSSIKVSRVLYADQPKGVDTLYGSYKPHGFPVRCLLK